MVCRHRKIRRRSQHFCTQNAFRNAKRIRHFQFHIINAMSGPFLCTIHRSGSHCRLLARTSHTQPHINSHRNTFCKWTQFAYIFRTHKTKNQIAFPWRALLLSLSIFLLIFKSSERYSTISAYTHIYIYIRYNIDIYFLEFVISHTNFGFQLN